MLAWIVAAALVCAICAGLGCSSLLAVASMGQGVAFLMMALSALVFFGAFEAYEATREKPAAESSEDA